MEISAAALPFLAAALGSLAHGLPALDFGMELRETNPSLRGNGGVHHPSDCCHSYTSRIIRCVFMESYYETSSGCSLPAVIFKTKRGQTVCADPFRDEVHDCVMKLAEANTPGTSLV